MSVDEINALFRSLISRLVALLADFAGRVVFRSMPRTSIDLCRQPYQLSYSWDNFQQLDSIVQQLVERAARRNPRISFLNVYDLTRNDAHPGSFDNATRNDCLHVR